MKKSLLELIHYFITDFSVSANHEHDPEKEFQLELSDLQSHISVRQIEDEDSVWQISLQLRQETPSHKNSPYNFHIQLIGLFELNLKFPRNKAEWFVLNNGTAMLYGAAREALRAGMAKGPHLPLLLPSVTFLPNEKDQYFPTKARSGKRSA
jgi:preprotein translocase subunit SecB